MSDILRSLRRSNRALRRVWRRRRRELKRRICGECGYQARMHIDQRSNHTDAEILAAAANLDGAERISELPKTCKHGQTTMHDHPNGESRCAGPIAEAKHYLRIPLLDKETPK